MEKLLLWTNCQTSGEKTIINYKEGSGNRNKDKGGGNIRKTQFPFFRSMSVSHNRKHSPAFIKCSQKSAQQTYGIIQVKPGTAQGSKSMKQKDLHGLASSVGISLNNLQESQSRCPRFKIRDSRSEIWALLFSVRGMTYLWFNHRDLRFSWEINVHCQIQSHYFVYFCVIWTSVVHVGFFFTCPNAGRDEGELFQLLWWRAVPGGKGNGDSKTDAQKTGINNFIPCYIVSLCYQQKGFVPCWANKKTFCLLWPNFVQRVVKEKDSGGEYAAPITPKSEKRVERKRETHKGKRKVLTEEKQSWKGIEIHQKQSFDVKFRYSKI